MTMPEYAKPFLEFTRLLYSVTATYEVLLRVAMVLVGMYLLVSDTVVVVAVVMVGVVWGWSLLDSLTFEPPPPPPPVSCCGGYGCVGVKGVVWSAEGLIDQLLCFSDGTLGTRGVARIF